MTPTVFVAYPLTAAAADLTAVQSFVERLKAAFAEGGWSVLPAVSDAQRVQVEPRSGEGRQVLSRNLDAVATSDLLVVLVPDVSAVSSIWIEFGVALGAGVRCIVVSPARGRLPFLASLAVNDSRRALAVDAEVPPVPDQVPATIAAILAAAASAGTT